MNVSTAVVPDEINPLRLGSQPLYRASQPRNEAEGRDEAAEGNVSFPSNPFRAFHSIPSRNFPTHPPRVSPFHVFVFVFVLSAVPAVSAPLLSRHASVSRRNVSPICVSVLRFTDRLFFFLLPPPFHSFFFQQCAFALITLSLPCFCGRSFQDFVFLEVDRDRSSFENLLVVEMFFFFFSFVALAFNNFFRLRRMYFWNVWEVRF